MLWVNFRGGSASHCILIDLWITVCTALKKDTVPQYVTIVNAKHAIGNTADQHSFFNRCKITVGEILALKYFETKMNLSWSKDK